MKIIKTAKSKVLILYNIFFIAFSVMFYFIIPRMLNYPPNSINNEFERTIDSGMNYYQQYILIVFVAILVANAFVFSQIAGVNKWEDFAEKKKLDKLEKIKERCFKTPYRIYILQSTIPTVVICFIMYITKTEGMLIFKTSVMMLTFTILLGLISYIFSEEFFTGILVKLKNRKIYSGQVRLGIRNKLFLQFFPLIFVSVLFSLIASNSMLTAERGDLIFQSYKESLTYVFEKEEYTLEEVSVKLKEIEKHDKNDSFFIATRDKIIFSEDDSKLSDFIVKYAFNVAKEVDGHTYGYYGTDIQGAVRYFNIDGVEYIAGVLYTSSLAKNFVFSGTTLLLLTLMCVFFIWYFSQSMSKNMSEVSLYMSKIIKHDEIDYDNKLSVTSDDEIGDLEVAFNEILDFEKVQIETIKSSQTALIEQERLASLGQLAGGMAHDINTPISAIMDGIEFLEGKHEYGEKELRMFEIMKVSSKKIIDIVGSVRNQIRNMNEDQNIKFDIREAMNSLQILLNNELEKSKCKLTITTGSNETLTGDMGKLIQIMMNIVINAIQAYDGKGGTIKINTYKENTNLIIAIKDNAGGIPKNIADGLFKEILTTKGTKGTGFGLYFSSSIIKAKFGGDITFDTTEGEGTTFYITIALIDN